MSDPSSASIGRRSLGTRMRRLAGAVRVSVEDPGHGLDRARWRLRAVVSGGAAPTCEYEPDPDCERHLHEALALAWPCEAHAEFAALWPEVTRALQESGLAVGRAAYGGWDDGDRALARTVWCLTRHLRPSSAVETGVARGITSRVILEALERNGHGHLWSIDLPALDSALHAQIGAAVPARARHRWTYVKGTSRRRLPRLLADLGEIELFVHDSSHTRRNLSFELEQAWGAMRAGAIVADDVERNSAFGDFMRARAPVPAFVASAEDGGAMFGVALKGSDPG